MDVCVMNSSTEHVRDPASGVARLTWATCCKLSSSVSTRNGVRKGLPPSCSSVFLSLLMSSTNTLPSLSPGLPFSILPFQMVAHRRLISLHSRQLSVSPSLASVRVAFVVLGILSGFAAPPIANTHHDCCKRTETTIVLPTWLSRSWTGSTQSSRGSVPRDSTACRSPMFPIASAGTVFRMCRGSLRCLMYQGLQKIQR